MPRANQALKTWISDTKSLFRILKSLPMKKLLVIGNLAGLNLAYYNRKTLLCKGLMLSICHGQVPNEMSKWK